MTKDIVFMISIFIHNYSNIFKISRGNFEKKLIKKWNINFDKNSLSHVRHFGQACLIMLVIYF
jgi:hypothetical protein